MANNETVNKVRSLLEGHCYGPLREAAEKWLEVADEKYAVKEKAGKVKDAVNDAADKFSDASAKFNETMADVSSKVADTADKISDNAGPALEKITDYAEKVVEKTTGAAEAMTSAGEKISSAVSSASDKIGDTTEKLAETELVKQLKEGICSVGDLIGTFGAKDAAGKFGEDFAEKMKAHAEELKAKGEKFCDCDACKKARSILKDFGVDAEAEFDAAQAEAAETPAAEEEIPD